MPARPDSDAAASIARAIGGFLRRGRLRAVHFAEGRRRPPPTALAVHFPRLALTLAGSDEIEIESAGRPHTLRLRQGEALFVPANCWNRPTWTRRVTALHLLFGQRQIGISLVEHDGRGAEPPEACKAGLPRAGSEPVSEILAALSALAARGGGPPVDATLVTALLQTVLGLLESAPAGQGRKARDTFEKACLYVQEHFQHDLTRDLVARQFHLNPNHLSRLFRREGLMRFTDYVSSARTERAKYLLRHGELSLGELAAACGFRDPAYFCRVFKRCTGQTPTAYRLASSPSAKPAPGAT